MCIEKKGKGVCIAIYGNPSHNFGVSLAIWDHSVTFHPTQANTPRLYPSQTRWYSIYRPLCKPNCHVPVTAILPALFFFRFLILKC